MMVRVEAIDVMVRGRRILSNLSFEVPDGKIVAVVGANGAGKTTLLDVIAGEVQPTSGVVSSGRSARVVQGSPLPATLTVAEIAMLATSTRKAALDLVSRFGLSQFAFSFAGELSTGMRRILDFACATSSGPEVLLLDEPSSGLARAEVAALAGLIKQFRDQSHCSIIVVEHDAWLVDQIADEVIVLDAGEIAARGAPGKILRARAKQTD